MALSEIERIELFWILAHNEVIRFYFFIYHNYLPVGVRAVRAQFHLSSLVLTTFEDKR